MAGRDVSGRGVQTNLLKLMEETEVPARAPNDIAGQIQAMMEMTQRGRKAASAINTRHILFIVSGAFDGLEKIVRRRLREAAIGFAAKGAAEPDDRGVPRARPDPRLHRVRLRAGIHRPPAGAGGLPAAHRGRPVPHPQDLRGQHHPPIRAGFCRLWHRGAFEDDGLRRIADLPPRSKPAPAG